MFRRSRALAATITATLVLGLWAVGSDSLPAAAQPTEPTPIAHTAGVKLVDSVTNTWGTFPDASKMDVWTEVLINGTWSRSQTRPTDERGNFVIPLTYGAGSPGSYTFRVSGVYPNGDRASSAPFELQRLANPAASSAGTKVVAATTNTWGRVHTDRAVTAWTEVEVNGNWSRSQTVSTDEQGNFVIPLTYGATTPGTYNFRVRSQYAHGEIGSSAPFELRRLAPPTAHSAGTKMVGQTTNAWGRIDTDRPVTAWTEVKINGAWSRSQTTTTDAQGHYVIPLTYGASTTGTYTFRVRAQYPGGTLATSPEFTLERTGGSKQDWMRAAGIPEADWQYVDFIVQRESGWNPSAVNRLSGACGLAQAYPCAKVGPRWNDPVVSLTWQYKYVTDRYGGYQGAYSFWLLNRWY